MTAGTLTPPELSEQKSFARRVFGEKALLDREPLPSPFKKGATVKYVGPDETLRSACGLVTWATSGIQGDLTHLTDIDGKRLYWNDDPDAPILWRTVDGCCGAIVHGKSRHITDKNKHEWVQIA